MVFELKKWHSHNFCANTDLKQLNNTALLAPNEHYEGVVDQMNTFFSCSVETKLDDDALVQLPVLAEMTPQHLLAASGT